MSRLIIPLSLRAGVFVFGDMLKKAASGFDCRYQGICNLKTLHFTTLLHIITIFMINRTA